VPEVVEQVLQEHHLHDWEYEFNLKQHYPRREQINQYQESDLAFIQRLLAEVGIFYFFTLQEEAQSEVVHFADAQRALMFDKTLPVNSPSGMSDSGTESIWGLSITHNVVEANVTTRDYNPRDAQSVLQSATADMTREMVKASLTVRYTTISFATGSVAIKSTRRRRPPTSMPASTMSVFWLTRRLLPRAVLQPGWRRPRC
jgi:type VI secretion system secreted protein VgrG